jgi:hypothetical protein
MATAVLVRGSPEMSRTDPVVVLGAGDVAARVARELLTAGHENLLLVTPGEDRVAILSEAFGEEAEVVLGDGVSQTIPEGALVVSTGCAQQQLMAAEPAIRRGNDLIVVTDDPEVLEHLMCLDDAASAAGVRVLIGAAMSPGLSCLMASFGAGWFDVVDEVHVARVGDCGANGGTGSRGRHRRSPRQWREGEWRRSAPGSGGELLWFPDPVGARECYVVDSGELTLLGRRFPDLRRAVVRKAMSRGGRLVSALPSVVSEPARGLLDGRDPIAAVRVDLRGSRDGARHSVVLGVIDLPTMATGVLVADAVGRLATLEPGVRTMGDLSDPGEVLAALRERGIRIAVAGDVG